MVNHSSPVDHPTDSDDTLVDSISDHQIAASQCSVPYVEGEPLPEPSYFDTLFEDIDGPLPGFPMRVPDLDCMVWGHLPCPDQFEVDEVDGEESKDRPALDAHRARIHADTYLDKRSGQEGGTSECRSAVALRLNSDSSHVFAGCILYYHPSIITKGPGALSIPARTVTITQAIFDIPIYGEVFFEKLFDSLDRTGTHLTTYYSRDGCQMADPAWQREPIPQLRIHIKAPTDNQLESFKATKVTWQEMAPLWISDANPRNGHHGHGGPTDARASLFIDPSSSAHRQVQLTYADLLSNDLDIKRFQKLHNLGAMAEPRPGQGTRAWISWVEDQEAECLRVNRAFVDRSSGLALDLIGLLNHCIDEAEIHCECEDVIIWDPPAEMWDAALALADDEKHGARYEVYKEEAKDLECFVRWNPLIREKIVWKQKQYYCFPGSWEGMDFL